MWTKMIKRTHGCKAFVRLESTWAVNFISRPREPGNIFINRILLITENKSLKSLSCVSPKINSLLPPGPRSFLVLFSRERNKALMTRRAALIQAEKKNKSTRSSTSDNKVVETPKRKMAPTTRSAAAKHTEEKNKSTHIGTTNKKIRVTPKRITAPITRSVKASLAQQKEDDKSTECRSTADRENFVGTPIIRNTYRRYGIRSRVHNKPVAHNTKSKTIKKQKKKKKPFACIFCNEKAFHTTEPHPSRAVGVLDCMSCGAAFKFKVTTNLTCGRDVQAALLAGGDIRWLSATQGIVGGWFDACCVQKI